MEWFVGLGVVAVSALGWIAVGQQADLRRLEERVRSLDGEQQRHCRMLTGQAAWAKTVDEQIDKAGRWRPDPPARPRQIDHRQG